MEDEEESGGSLRLTIAEHGRCRIVGKVSYCIFVCRKNEAVLPANSSDQSEAVTAVGDPNRAIQQRDSQHRQPSAAARQCDVHPLHLERIWPDAGKKSL